MSTPPDGPELAGRNPTPPPADARRHCWVTGPAEAPGPHPGLVLEWRKDGDTWLGYVLYFIDDEHTVVQQWLSADLLRPL